MNRCSFAYVGGVKNWHPARHGGGKVNRSNPNGKRVVI